MSIPACAPGCPAPDAAPSKYKWCSYEVQRPHVQWEALDARLGGSRDADKRAYAALESVGIYLVQEAGEVAPALAALYDSMRDPIIGIDTEWKPDSRAAMNDVAMLQLASSTVVVLLRTCSLGELPQAVVDFCRDDAIVGVGFDWSSNDERKMQESFGLGAAELFGTFVDVRAQAEVMGHHGCNLGSLARRLLGFQPPASKEVTMSNWEATHLTPRQLRYASLDALLSGDLLRALRRLHASPAPCPGCALPLGAWPGALDLRCPHPDCLAKKGFGSVSALAGHMRQKGHSAAIASCDACGRWSSADGVVRLTPEEAAAQPQIAHTRNGGAALPLVSWPESTTFLAAGADQAGSQAEAPAAASASASAPQGGQRKERGGRRAAKILERRMHEAYGAYC